MSADNLACPECGHRQAGGAGDGAGRIHSDRRDRCTACSYDGMLDLDNTRHVELLRDIDQRRLDNHSDRTRKLAVGVAMAIVFALWFVPGYWHVRGTVYPGLPLLADQWAFMIIIALGLWKLLDRMAPKSRFPYLPK